MSKIIGKIWKDKRNAPKIQVSYTISVCEVILNPSNLTVQINEETTKHLITKNYVSFEICVNNTMDIFNRFVYYSRKL